MVPKGCQIYHPLGFNWHPLEGAGTYTCTILYTIYIHGESHISLSYLYLPVMNIVDVE